MKKDNDLLRQKVTEMEERMVAIGEEHEQLSQCAIKTAKENGQLLANKKDK